MNITLNEGQKSALRSLNSSSNVFLTGQAGVGKTTVVKEFMKTKRWSDFPMLASTGMAAILLGGRTLHSYFGIGIMEGGADETIERSVNSPKVCARLRSVEGILIDEISMVSSEQLMVMENIASIVRENIAEPWGGLQVVAVGDFAQLPPVDPYKQTKQWAFESDTWKDSKFRNVMLSEVMRSSNKPFIDILNHIRK
jgi:ATP-dependent DNA helicase PIF1